MAIASYALSALAIPAKPSPSASASAKAANGDIKKVATLSTLLTLLLAVPVPPFTPADLNIRFQKYTPGGLVQVADSVSDGVRFRYLRQDATILGLSELATLNGTTTADVAETLLPAVAIQDAVRFVDGVRGKSALVL